ncbi:MAG: AAA family ATPase [Stagnimonas sp.]|nr:AAA family ATPase [Stagnimonas sp.]
MKIVNLEIRNFRGISHVKLSNLGSMIIIAGQNGSGKSCIFDAIRLLKSVYGGYQANEWQHWMGEFQLTLSNRPSDFLPIFNDKTKELRITCDFQLSEEERQYITQNAYELLTERAWPIVVPELQNYGGRAAILATQFRERQGEVNDRVKAELPQLITELAKPTLSGSFFIKPGITPQIQNSLSLSLVFSTFRPQNLGVIDYHGAQRHYNRENVQGINLNLDAQEQKNSQSALYNYSNKYTNIKGEMAASYVKEALAEKARASIGQGQVDRTLTTTLVELFQTFFPGKKFLGPQATLEGLLTFPVETGPGRFHDLDDLSAGEKEIIYGYLRIRNSAPKFSIILLDEPELHLNPRLIRGLPQFYKKNLGEALHNQLWLVTHSDALLREVVGRGGYSVFHMLPSGEASGLDGQIKAMSATADLDLAVADLVGDLASFRPGAKVIILEGGGDSDFDQKVVSALFPSVLEHANLISGSNKIRVRGLLDILDSATKKGGVPFKFFAITDKDSGDYPPAFDSLNSFSWNVYHIENYFLNPEYILKALDVLQIKHPPDEDSIWELLRECARETIPQLVRHQLSEYANAILIKSINVGSDPRLEVQAPAISEAINRSIERITSASLTSLTQEALEKYEADILSQFTKDLASGAWTSTFMGRNILSRFVSKMNLEVSYIVFIKMILGHMKDCGHQPQGMREIIDKIVKA